jgi:hypothetical protein
MCALVDGQEGNPTDGACDIDKKNLAVCRNKRATRPARARLAPGKLPFGAFGSSILFFAQTIAAGNSSNLWNVKTATCLLQTAVCLLHPTVSIRSILNMVFSSAPPPSCFHAYCLLSTTIWFRSSKWPFRNQFMGRHQSLTETLVTRKNASLPPSSTSNSQFTLCAEQILIVGAILPRPT